MNNEQENETTEKECSQCKGKIEHDHEEMCDACREHHELHTWNHMGVVNILCADGNYIGRRGANDVVSVYGDDLQVTLDVGSNGYEGEHQWVNHAGVHITENYVEFHLSLFDPRGAFVFRTEQKDNDTVIMGVPHPNDPLSHGPLTPMSISRDGDMGGVFFVGHSDEANEAIAFRARRAGVDYCLCCGDKGDEGEATENDSYMCAEHGCTCEGCYCHQCETELCMHCGGLYWHLDPLEHLTCERQHKPCNCIEMDEARAEAEVDWARADGSTDGWAVAHSFKPVGDC